MEARSTDSEPHLLAGQRALITGAGSGIGRAVAEAFANAGASVLIDYPGNREKADRVAANIVEAGGRASVVRADISREQDVGAMFAAARDRYGGIDILVNNAGIQKDAPIQDMSLADWQAVIDVNLTGQFLCARAAVREFLRQGMTRNSRAAGKIIFISSVHELIPWAGHANYAASKGGVMMLVKTLAQELARHRIRVNSIAPGAIETLINEAARDTAVEREKLLELIPYGRVGEPADIGRAAVWLASDQSDYMTGATLYIDGGMLLYPGFIGNG